MFSWETALTTRDTNRIVRPVEWGFDWLKDFSPLEQSSDVGSPVTSDLSRMIALNEHIVRHADAFYSYQTPTDFRLERRHPQLFPTNVRPETLAQDAELKLQAQVGELEEAEHCDSGSGEQRAGRGICAHREAAGGRRRL